MRARREADPLPKADAILVMPATFNMINKWTQGMLVAFPDELRIKQLSSFVTR